MMSRGEFSATATVRPAGCQCLSGALVSPLAAPHPLSAWRDYPDRSQVLLRQRLLHGAWSPSFVLPGNGAAELFTWAARDAAEQGLSVLAAPGFADYKRALRCWSATSRQQQLPLLWDEGFPQPFPDPGEGSVLWICNPHNPTGQLWSRASLQPLLERYALVICDEAFLPLVPNGEQQSLIPLVAEHSNLVVIRSLTKLYGIAGLRLGYAVAQPQRLQRWAEWRDPWPVNGIALAVGERLLASPAALPPLVRARAALDGNGGGVDAAEIGSIARHHSHVVGRELPPGSSEPLPGAVAGSIGATASHSFA